MRSERRGQEHARLPGLPGDRERLGLGDQLESQQGNRAAVPTRLFLASEISQNLMRGDEAGAIK